MAQNKREMKPQKGYIPISPMDSSIAYLMRCRRPSREFGKRALRILLNRLRLRKAASADISPPDPCYKVVYLGNVVTGLAKGEGCLEKPLGTLWRNYTHSSRADVRMQLSVSGGGLRATTRDHGLTEYWAHRISFCAAPTNFPRLFCWVYRHEGRRLRHELRCHAVLCSSASVARKLSIQLKTSLALALAEFKRDKISRQNARLSLVNACYDNPTMPRRKILLSTGSQNYRPPLERSKSAPKLTMIEENLIEEEEEDDVFEGSSSPARKMPPQARFLRHSDSTSLLLDKHIDLRTRLEMAKKDFKGLPPLQPKRLSELRCSEISAKESSHSQTSCPMKENDEAKMNEDKTQKGSCFTKRNFSLRRCKNRSSNKMLKEIPVVNKFVDVDDENDDDIILEQSELKELSLELENIDAMSKHLIEEIINETLADCNGDEEEEKQLLCEGQPWLDSDDGSLSSGCESGSSATSDFDRIRSKTNSESSNSSEEIPLNFKLGESVLARVRSLEAGADGKGRYVPDVDEVSLIPVGEVSNDFSSLRIFKKKLEPTTELATNQDTVGSSGEEENASSCSDESGYVELLEPVGETNKVQLV